MNGRRIELSEQGAIARLGSSDVLSAIQLIKSGRVYDLDAGRFNNMPQWDGHPKFILTSYRTPSGARRLGDLQLLDQRGNSEQLGIHSELIVGGMHLGTHIDALCHITCGPDDSWYGGYNPVEHFADFGPLYGDAASIVPIVIRATMLDVAAHLGLKLLPPGFGIAPELLKDVSIAQKTPVLPGTCVILRTGLMSTWPNPEDFASADGAGPNLAGAKWLVEECGAVLVGSDTPSFEQIPAASRTNPHPVHEYLLRQRGVHIIEDLMLEELSADKIYQFAFICLPLKVYGATGSWVRPVAIC